MTSPPPLSPNAQHITSDGKPTKDFYNWLKKATAGWITSDDTVAFLNKTFGDPTDVLGGVTVTLGSDAKGDIWYRNASGILTRLPIGSTGNVLTVASGLPSWAAPAPSGLAYLGSVSVASGAIADTTIIAANNSAYRSFKLILKNIIATTNTSALLLLAHSGGSFQATTYASYYTASVGGNPGGSTQTGGIELASNTSSSDPGISGSVEVSNLSSTSVHKTWVSLCGGALGVTMQAGYWDGGTGAIDGFQIIDSHSATDLVSGSVDIYGIQ